jgi:hypothetical protein
MHQAHHREPGLEPFHEPALRLIRRMSTHGLVSKF